VSYAVLLERQAEKELRSPPSKILRRIDKRLLALVDEPFPRGALKQAITVFFTRLIKHRKL
jgi:mRNA-degrading endonuclease RelE of RelBE toxin-antitoxin system